MLFFALFVHFLAPAARFRIATLTYKVVIRLPNHAYLRNVANVIEHKRKIVPKRILKTNVELLNAAAQKQLIPRRVQQILVEQLIRCRAKRVLRRKHARRIGFYFGCMLIVFAIVSVDVKTGNHQLKRVRLHVQHHIGEHATFGPIIGIEKHNVGATSALKCIIAGCGRAGVGRVKYRNAKIALRRSVEDGTRSIG